MINPPVSNQLLFRSRAQDEHVALLRRQRIPAGFVFYDQDMLDVAAVGVAIFMRRNTRCLDLLSKA